MELRRSRRPVKHRQPCGRTRSSAFENVGRLAFALRPPTLDEFGLAPALKDLGGCLEERGGPKVELEIDLPAGTRLPAKLETAIFRITQEALTNVVKHAEATTVRIAFACRERSVVLTVEDDGRGFSRAAEPVTGSGSSGCASGWRPSTGHSTSNRRRGAGTRLAVEFLSPEVEIFRFAWALSPRCAQLALVCAAFRSSLNALMNFSIPSRSSVATMSS